MRTLKLVAFLLVGVANALAQKSPKESASVLLGVHEQVLASSQYSMRISYLGSVQPDPYFQWQTNYLGLTTPAQSPNVVANITPGQQYIFTTSCANWNGGDIQFNVPPGYTLYMGLPGYPCTPHTTIAIPNYNGGTGTFIFFFYVIPSDGASWLAPGYATAPRLGDITWAVSTGSLASGYFAGAIRLRSSSVAQSLLDSSSLLYAPTAATVTVTTQNYVPPPDIIGTYYETDNATIKYVTTLQAQYYIRRQGGFATKNGGYTIEVYSQGVQYSWPGGDPTQAWTFAGADNIEYTISNPDNSWQGDVQITKLDRASNTIQKWTLSQTSGASTTLTEVNALQIIKLVSTTIAGGRTETYNVWDNNNVPAISKNRTYQNFPWGEELTSEVDDPGNLAITTTYSYYNTTLGDGHYSKLSSVVHQSTPTQVIGSWVQYDYYDDFARWGELAGVYTPWQDSPSSPTTVASNCKFVAYNYAPERTVFSELFAGTVTKILGVISGQEAILPTVSSSSIYSVMPIGNQPIRTDIISDYSASGVAQVTVRKVFHNTADLVFNGKLYSQTNPDGTKTSASYWRGTFNSWLGSSSWNASNFAPVSNASSWCETYLTGTASQGDPSAVQATTDGTTGGNAVDPVWMTPYKSYRRQVMRDAGGNPLFDVNEVYTGTGYQIISWTQNGYDGQGMLISYQKSTGEHYFCNRTAGVVTSERKPDGTGYTYTLDALLRVTNAEKASGSGNGIYPSQPATETAYIYDGAGNLLSTTTTPSGGGASLQTSTSYNLAGLLTTQENAAQLVTNVAYTNGGRTVTTTLPGGSIRVDEKYLDGSVKSTTGNAQVPQYVSRTNNGDGTITTTTSLGSSGSARSSSVQADWLGRTILQSQPAFGGGTQTKQSFYNSLGQLTKTTQTGMAPILYQYDGLGQLQYSGLDVNNSGQLDLGGSDRITETRSQVYVDSNSVWWKQDLTYVFNQAGSSTPVLKSEVRTKLVPYPSTQSDYNSGVKITETDSYDYFRNLTTEVVNGSVATAIVTDTTTLPSSAVPKVTVAYNGLLVSSQSPQNIVTTYHYDGLGRETSEVDPRKGTSSTTYFTSGAGQIGQVSSRSDAAGDTTSYAYNATDGRLFSQTDPLTYTVYHAYDHAGREIKTWGTGTYPVEYAFDAYGAKIAMRTFGRTSINFGTTTWPLSDDGGDSQNPTPGSWTSGDTTAWIFDSSTGLLTSKTDAAGKSVGYTYNSLGKLASRTWARGVATTYSYDPNTAEQIGVSYSDGTPGLTYAFDRLGHGSSIVQAYSGFSLTTGLQYNVPGKLTQETFDSSYWGGRQLVYQLDTTNSGTLGRTVGYEVGTSSSPSLDQAGTFGYDADGRLDAVGLAGGPTFTYAYATNSNLIGSVTDSPDIWSQSRAWDPHRDLLTSIQTSVGTATEGSFSYVYDSLGRRTSKLETGNLFARYPAGGLVDAYTYDSKSEVTADQEYHSTNLSSPTTPVIGRGFAYAYDPIGNRITSAVDSQQVTYTSNSLNEITSRVVPGYYPASGLAPIGATVTLNGSAIPSGQINGQYYLQNVTANNSSGPLWLTANLSSSLGGSQSSNAFLPQSPETSSYDLDGNLLSDGRWNYFWDGENRLTAMETLGNQSGNSKSVWNSGVPLEHLDFKYDYQGRRISKAVSNWNGSAFVLASETRYAYENWNLVADYSVSGGTLSFGHSYLWGIDLSGRRHGAGGVGGLLAMVATSGAVELPIYDANGNVQGLTDWSTGQITAAYEYSPFGELLRANGAYAAVNPFQFSSKYTDSETRLIYYGHRYYNPALGRFLGRDGIGEKGGLHLYAFVANNAVNGYDILGHDGNSTGLPPGVTPANAFQYGYSQNANGTWYYNYGSVHNSYNGFGYLNGGGNSGGAPGTLSSMVGTGSMPGMTGGQLIAAANAAAAQAVVTWVNNGMAGDGEEAFNPQAGSTTGALSARSPDDPSWSASPTPSQTYKTSDGGSYSSVAGGTPITNPSNPGVYWADSNTSSDPSLLSGVGGALFSNLSWKTGGDAAYGVGTSNSISVGPNGTSGDIEGTTGYGAIAYSGVQGTIPLVSNPGKPVFTVGGTVADGLAAGLGASFNVAHWTVYNLPNGGNIQINVPYPTQLNFFLGAGMGGEGKVTPPDGSINIIHVPDGEYPVNN